MAIKFLSDVLGSGELEGVTIEAMDNIIKDTQNG